MTAQPESADYDTALPGAQTELAPSASETEAHTAWALDDDQDWPAHWWSPARITTAAVLACGVLVAVAAVTAVVVQRDGPGPREVVPTPSSVVAAPPPPITVTTVLVQPPTKTVTLPTRTWQPPEPSRPPADLTLGLPPQQLAAYDAQFLDSLRAKWNWSGGNDVDMAHDAHAVCVKLQRGEDLPQISQELAASSGIDVSSAHIFASEALMTYPNCHS